MNASSEGGLATVIAIVGVLGVLVSIAVYVWYAMALSRLFPRIGGEGWKGWVPILNEAEILARGGVPAWSVVFYFIPIVQLYGIYLKVVATHRINQQFGRGAGSTALAILLPPVWATLLAWGAPPFPAGDRADAAQSPVRRSVNPAASSARDASGYMIPSLAPQNAGQQHDAALVFPDYAAPVAQDRPVAVPAAPVPPAPPAGPFSAGNPPQTPSFAPPAPSPAAPPAAPFSAPFSAPPAAMPQSLADAPTPPPAWTPPPVQQAQTPPPAAHAQTPPAPPRPPVAGPVPPMPPAPPRPPMPPVEATPVAPPAPPVLSPSAPAPVASGIIAAMSAEPADQRPAGEGPASLNAEPIAVPAPVEQPAPVSASPDAIEGVLRAVRPAPPSFREGETSAAESPSPAIRPAPAVAPAVAEPVVQPVIAPAAVEPVVPVPPRIEHAVIAPEALRPNAGLPGDVDKTVVTARPADDDLDATVVVVRKRGVRRVLVLDDGRSFALSGASVVIGRNPIGDPGEQRLAISDTTRTLSKTHARLIVQEDEWRLTDLHATNGVVVVSDDGSETLLDPGESVIGTGRFILGEVGMHVVAERDS